MTQSNSKLTASQKEYLRETLKPWAKAAKVQTTDNGQTTVAFTVRGSTVLFTTSVASGDEKKFRRSVGKFHALGRLEGGEGAILEKSDFLAFCDYLSFRNKYDGVVTLD